MKLAAGERDLLQGLETATGVPNVRVHKDNQVNGNADHRVNKAERANK